MTDPSAKTADRTPIARPVGTEPSKPVMPYASTDPADFHRSWPMRIWMALPDWSFRAAGAAFFLVFFAWRFRAYFTEGFWQSGAYYRLGEGHIFFFPWGRVLIDATYLVIAAGFILRVPPHHRASNGLQIAVSLLGAFWPFLPFVASGLLELMNAPFAAPFAKSFVDQSMSFSVFLFAVLLISVGNAMDVWGYAYLCRSLSIVPEARVLKVTGPYRWVRHPIYLGQMIAQAGVWLVLAPLHLGWIVFYACFVALQLYRARLEDRVLEATFGKAHRAWMRRTFWFW